MKNLAMLSAIGLIAGSAMVSSNAEAAGCIKGAIVGGVAGKLAGHGVAGAAVGCAYGVHKRNQAERTNQTDPQHAARRTY